MLRFFVNLVQHFVLFNHSLGFLELHIKILKIYIVPVVQLYVEMFEHVNRFLLFQINLLLNFYKIHFVHEVQIMVILKMEVLNILGYLHFESFLCCITVNV